MGLETVTYISDFVTTNPVGATDPKSQGDDHIRNIKLGVKNTFPNITGAVTATQAELNILDGVTLTAGEINDAARKSAANVFLALQTITIADTAQALQLRGDTGMIRFRPYVTTGAIVEATNLAGDAYKTLLLGADTFQFNTTATGTLADFTLAGVAASDFARKSTANSYTNAAQGISATNGAWSVTDSGVTAAYTANWGGTTSNNAWALRTNNTARLTVNADGTILAPAVANSTSTTLVAGQLHFITGNATLPNLAAGEWIELINDSASSITISKNASDTTYWTATGASVSTSFTLAARGRLSAVCSPAGSVVYVSGNITAAT